MADGVKPKRGKAKRGPAQAAAPELTLPINLPPAMFTGPGLLALADLLPVMTAYLDRDLVYRFMNKPLAEWFGRPRSAMLGRPMAEVIGAAPFAERVPMLKAA